MLQSVAPGSPPDDPVRGLGPCSTPPRMLQSGASICRHLSVASDAPVRGTGFTPGRSSPGASAVLHSAPVAPIQGVFLSYSLRCLGCSSLWHRVLPRTIQSGGLGRAPLRPGCFNPGRPFVVFSPLPRMLQSVAPGSPPDDLVRGLGPCSTLPRMLQSGASFYRILSIASDAPVRGTWFTPGRSSPGASAVLHSAPVAPIRGVFLSYSLRCLGCSCLWHRVHPRTIQSGRFSRASFRPGCSIPGRLFVVFSPLPRLLQSVAPGSPPDDPVRGLGPCSTLPRMLLSGASFYRILSVASDVTGEADYTRGATGGDSNQSQTTSGTMTTTTPGKRSPRGHQGAHPRSHQCAHHPHVPQRTRRPVRRSQSSRPARRTCHGEVRPRRHVVAGTGPQNQSGRPQPNPHPRQDRTPIPHHMGQGGAHIPQK